MNNKIEVSYFDVLEECSDVLHQIVETGNSSLMNSMLAQCAAQCVDEKIAEIDQVIHRVSDIQEMKDNIDYIMRRLSNDSNHNC